MPENRGEGSGRLLFAMALASGIAPGRLADVFGRVRLLTIGTLIYMGASIPAALAGSPTVLIAGLAAAGVGGAVVSPRA